MLEVLAGATKQSKETAGDQIGDKEIKPVLLAGNMILYLENPKSVTRKHLSIMNTFSKELDLYIYSNQHYISL